ncbi:MAG: serine/threonine-protein kinase [Actinomycetota bacterium]|nr:serine/threonine-protein kinase [Actinomycetota bacterium]
METLRPSDPSAIGRWRIVARLSAGGSTDVFCAIDDDGRRAAIKALGPWVAADPALRRRLEVEADALERCGVDGVARLVEIDVDGPLPYLATELVAGPDLRARLRHGPLGCGDALAIGTTLARTLAAVHARGLVHGDVKPANVVLGPDGPVLVDFGLATHLADLECTRPGAFAGSPGWIAPEQVRGEDLTAAVDVFGWGGTIAFVSSGRSPFGDGRADALCYRAVHEEPDLSGVCDDLRPAIAAALVKDRAGRPTAAQLAAMLAGGVRSIA